jgi:ADP-ribose pyrophosphatase YjhB (NUDIX family)
MNCKSNKYFRFCPVCAGKLAIKKHDHVKRLVCNKCDFIFYQNSKPTVSAFIINKKGQILLVKRAINPRKGLWDTPGGFLEDGEKPIMGLRREMKEELGILLKDLKFLGIYIDTYCERYEMTTLNILYQAEIASGKLRPMDDVGALKWFGKKDIPWKKSAFRWMKRALLENFLKR